MLFFDVAEGGHHMAFFGSPKACKMEQGLPTNFLALCRRFFWPFADDFFAIATTKSCGMCRRNSEYSANAILVSRAGAFCDFSCHCARRIMLPPRTAEQHARGFLLS